MAGTRSKRDTLTAENEPGQRVSALAVIPGLLGEWRVDPAEILASAGLHIHILDDAANWIPYAVDASPCLEP